MALKGRVAWVTGGGRGIGRACALALADAGVGVALSARTRKELEAVATECASRRVPTLAAPCDVTQRKAVEKAHAQIAKVLGAPTILVNGAGLARSEAFLKTSPEFLEDLWRLNVVGTFHCTQVALPAMLEEGWGRVVNVASVAGKHGAPYISAYAATKHAVLGLTRSLAAEYATKGVTVNAVCPGYVDTKMTEDNVDVIVKRTKMSREEALDRIRSYSPQKRLIQPEEVAATVVHLCREESVGINGQALTIDGGALQW